MSDTRYLDDEPARSVRFSKDSQTEGANTVCKCPDLSNNVIYLAEIPSGDRIVQRGFRKRSEHGMKPDAVRSEAVFYETEHSPLPDNNFPGNEKLSPIETFTHVPPNKLLKIYYREKQVYVSKPTEDGQNEIIVYPVNEDLNKYLERNSDSSVIEITFRTGDKKNNTDRNIIACPLLTSTPAGNESTDRKSVQKTSCIPQTSFSSAPRNSYCQPCNPCECDEMECESDPKPKPKRGFFSKLCSCGSKKQAVSVGTSFDTIPANKRSRSERRSTCSSRSPERLKTYNQNGEPEMESCICNPCDLACGAVCEGENPDESQYPKKPSTASRGRKCSSTAQPFRVPDRNMYLQEVFVPGCTERLFRITKEPHRFVFRPKEED